MMIDLPAGVSWANLEDIFHIRRPSSRRPLQRHVLRSNGPSRCANNCLFPASHVYTYERMVVRCHRQRFDLPAAARKETNWPVGNWWCIIVPGHWYWAKRTWDVHRADRHARFERQKDLRSSNWPVTYILTVITYIMKTYSWLIPQHVYFRYRNPSFS